MFTELPGAVEKSSVGIVVSFTDEDGVALIPTTITWSLADLNGAIINSRTDIAIAVPAATQTVVLSGDDLALKNAGYKVILINSNPATIMTDPETADRTYIEPITPEMVEKIIKKEKPDSLLPTLGGQTGLNVAVELAEKGILKKHKVKMLGANLKIGRASCKERV